MAYTSLLTQTATRFSTPTPDGFGGNTGYTATTHLVRWQNEQLIEQDEAGLQFPAAAVVYASALFAINDWLFLGTTSEVDPQLVDGAFRIRRVYVTRNPSGSIIVYKYVLGY